MLDPDEFLTLEYREFKGVLRGWKGFLLAAMVVLIGATLGARYFGLW